MDSLGTSLGGETEEADRKKNRKKKTEGNEGQERKSFIRKGQLLKEVSTTEKWKRFGTCRC